MKTEQKRHCRTLMAAALFLLASATCFAEGHMTPEFARGDFRPKSIVLIPPQATVTKNKVASTEQMIEEGSRLEDAAALELQKQFHAIGYELRILSVAEVNAEPELQAMIRNLNDRYDEETSRFRMSFTGGIKGEDVRERRFKLGDAARIVASKLGTDAIAIGRIAAQGATGGQKTMAVLFGGSVGFAALNIGIVAGDNGDLEAFYMGVDNAMSPEKLESQPIQVMADVVLRTLKNFPGANEPGDYKKRWPQDSGREVPAAAQSDDAAMSEFEEMFGDEPMPETVESSEDDAGATAGELPDADN